MWLLNMLPIDLMLVIVHGILAVGLIGLLISFASKFIPGVGLYSLPIRIVSIVIIFLGIYMEGVVGTHQWYQDAAKEMQAKLEKAEAQSQTLNTQLTAEIQKNEQVITNHTETIHTEVREKLVPIDNKCELDPLVISILNRSASNPLTTAPTATPEAKGENK
jgi:ABC-type multidrug transport system fused ATPase/permease subunit